MNETPTQIDVNNLFKNIIAAESAAVASIPAGEGYAKALELILEHTHTRHGKIVVSGMGKCGQIAMNIATTFCSTGTPAVFLHPAEAQHGDLGIMQPDDLLLLLSNSGKTREIVELVQLARRLNPNVPLIVITGNDKSPLAQAADVCLHTGGNPEVCPLGLTPTVSTTQMTVMGDVLVVATMTAIGLTAYDYSLRHHGGYLGSEAKKVAAR